MAGPLKPPNQFAIYNVLGEEVTCVEDVVFEDSKTFDIMRGRHLTTDSTDVVDTAGYAIEMDGFDSGIYFYKIWTLDTTISKKKMLLK